MHDDDELTKKRRLPPSSGHQIAAEQYTQDRLDQMRQQQVEALQPHRNDYARLQVEDGAEMRRRAEQEAARYLEERQHVKTDQSPTPPRPHQDPKHDQDRQRQPSPEVVEQHRRMTEDQRSRHEAFIKDPSIDDRAALQAARVIRHEYERRQAPELGAIRTRRSNEESDRELRLSERRPQPDPRSHLAQDADAVVRRQDHQQKDADRQERLREQGSDTPLEKLQDMKVAKAEAQRLKSWGDRYETTREERQEVEKSHALQQRQGLTRGR